jgi:hypothetical protein
MRDLKAISGDSRSTCQQQAVVRLNPFGAREVQANRNADQYAPFDVQPYLVWTIAEDGRPGTKPASRSAVPPRPEAMSLGDRAPVLVCGVGLGTLMYTCALSTTERAERRRAAWRGWLEAGVARACSLVLDRGDAESARLRALERRLEAVEGRVRQRQLTPHERQKLRLWVDGLEAELEAKERRLGSAAGRGRVRKPASSSSSHSGAGAAWPRLRNWVGAAGGGAVRLRQRLSSTRDALRLAEEEHPPLPGSDDDDDDDTGYPAPQAASTAAGMAGALVGMQAVASGAGGTSTVSGPLAYEPEAVDSRLLLPLPHHDPSSWAEDKERLQAMMFADGDDGGGWSSDGGGAHRSGGRGRSSSSSRGGGGGGSVLECFSALFLGEEEQPVALGQVLADHGDELPPTILCAMAALALRVDPAADDSLFASSAVAAEEEAVVGSHTRRRQQQGRGAATTRGAPAPPRGSSPRPSPPPHVLAAAPHCEALSLSAEQVGCLLANEFFGTLPHPAHLPPPSLSGAGPLPLRALITAEAPHGYAACACLLHYFESLIVLTSSSSSSSSFSSAYITYRAKLPLRQLTHVRDQARL